MEQTLTKKMKLIAALNETILAQVEEENIEAGLQILPNLWMKFIFV